MFDKTTKILVVDDMKTMRMYVGNALGKLGFNNLTLANDGREAWMCIESARNDKIPYGLIISDWNMPKLDGLTLLKLVRGDGVIKNTPFLMVTAETEVAQVKEAITEGVNNYITKPFSAETFKAKLEAVYANLKKAA